MSAETELYAALSGHAPLLAIVADRIHFDVLPEETDYPAVVFSRESTAPILSTSGRSFGAEVLAKVSCWGKTRTEADAAAVEAEAALVAAELTPSGKVSGYDPETDLYATVLDVEIVEEP
jgi:hypothetical protein